MNMTSIEDLSNHGRAGWGKVKIMPGRHAAGALDVFGVADNWCAGPENLSYRQDQLSLAVLASSSSIWGGFQVQSPNSNVPFLLSHCLLLFTSSSWDLSSEEVPVISSRLLVMAFEDHAILLLSGNAR
ncbi:hypothetical protein BO94DRAFT_547204 [Aspergillus sclerotioniger CBS 115572]|uniref:Uncharacterized protein n=1 Tax=Aspergillus sclerotioniger CBS 115572 TaxID=1450535 RepID=A0A317WDS2_9EURO|nr:hypothetical protein BO94DRAFT_547204 [Aspergillus sclerotioniger CBS 115572]PWY84616.1 hypothetical protein BO94DRAFT_547204 [Aspergillus sclerotioniger CBS 115572]